MTGDSAATKKDALGRALSSLGAVRIFNSTAAASKRCLIIAPQADRATQSAPAGVTVTDETLDNAVGGFPDGSLGKRARVMAVPGPDCTLGDVAAVVLPLYQQVAPNLTVEELTCAIFAYNASVLLPGVDFAACPVPAPCSSDTQLAWRVGDQLTLPLEIKDTSGAKAAWVTEMSLICARAADGAGWKDFLLDTNPANKATDLELPPNLHVIPELDALTSWAAAAPSDNECNALADALRGRMLANSYEAVFFALEALGRLCAADAAAPPSHAALTTILAVLGPLAPHHASLLATLSGGNAVLRRFYRQLEAARAADPTLVGDGTSDFMKALRLVATALGLVPAPSGTDASVATKWLSWCRRDNPDSTQYGPLVSPLEPPFESYMRSLGADGKKLPIPVCSAMALGRRIDVSNSAKYRAGVAGMRNLSFPKPFGPVPDEFNRDPACWLVQHLGDDADDVRAGRLQIVCDLGPAGGNYPPEASPVAADKVRARMQLAAMISINEGAFDSCQAGDTAIMSFGLQQWGAANNENLTVLWERFRALYPEQYDLFFGMWGIETRRWLPDMNAKSATTAAIDGQNRFGADPSTFDPAKSAAENERLYFPSHATFFRLQAGKARDIPGESGRKALFLQPDDGRAWCARARLAALCSPEYLRVQIHTAAWRLTGLQFYVATDLTLQPLSFQVLVNGKSQGFKTRQLFASWLGAALALDQHINRPVLQAPDTKTAILNVAEKLATADIDPDTGGPKTGCKWNQAFIASYIARRRMTDAKKRSTAILALNEIPGGEDPANPPPQQCVNPMDPNTSPNFPGW